jgi:hypothetical protein
MRYTVAEYQPSPLRSIELNTTAVSGPWLKPQFENTTMYLRKVEIMALYAKSFAYEP